MLCKGVGLTKEMLPFVPGHEIIGTIQYLGERAKISGKFRDGDRVAVVSKTGGGNSRFISIPANRLTKIPTEVQSSEAVCMIHDYMGALRALRLAKKGGSPFTGKSILVTDGFSPMGQAIINLANMEGAEIYCCAHESKHAYLASMGVKCFEKNPEAWLPKAQGTFDVVIDNSCMDAYSSSWYALKDKGKLICLGPLYKIEADDLSQGGCGIIEVAELQQKWAQLKAKYIMSQTMFLNTETIYDEDVEQYQQDLRYLMFLLERGTIKPKIAELVSLNDVSDAQRLMESGKANGTVVCTPWVEE
jgi:NADPH2:quinone reductase